MTTDVRPAVLTGNHFMNGDVAAAEGALAAGCNFFAGYPITPSTEVAERLAQRLPEVGGRFIQMEDELGSIAAVLGAAWGGARAMTATSGPGFTLMMENLGLAVMTETPCVIVDVQRGSPSTGLPTAVGQSDVMQAKWGSHGDYQIVAYSPSSPQEMFDVTVKAFNTAERLRIPVIILADEVDGVALLIIPVAVAVHSVLAWAFGLTSRPGWHSTMFGPYFVVAALLSGVGAVILVVAAFRKAYHLEQFIQERHFRYLASIMLVLGVMYLYFTISELLTEGYLANEESAPALEALLLDRFAPFFWLFVIVGGAVPTLLVSLPWTRTIPGIVIAAALAVAGMWLKRLLIVVPPLSEHVFQADSVAYRASTVEALVTLSAVAAIPLLLMLFFRVFPVLSIAEMEEVIDQHDIGVVELDADEGSYR